jgi:hypothetical protein
VDLGSVVYGLIAGAIIVLIAWTMGYHATPGQRQQRMGYFFIAIFLVIVLQWAGAGASFAAVSVIAAVLLLLYLAVRRVIVRQPR